MEGQKYKVVKVFRKSGRRQIMAKRADTLAREYELGNEDYNFYDYIIESLINGQRQQVRDLFNMMHKDDKHNFLINYLDESIGYQKSVKNICIAELN